MPDPTWHELYGAAVLEFDPSKLTQRIEDARRAIHQRLVEHDGSVGAGEREKIDDALRALWFLAKRRPAA
jgi:hypothetical protein